MEKIDDFYEHPDCLEDLLHLANVKASVPITNTSNNDIGLDFLLGDLCNVSESPKDHTFVESLENSQFTSGSRNLNTGKIEDDCYYKYPFEKAPNEEVTLVDLCANIEKTSNSPVCGLFEGFYTSGSQKGESSLLDFLVGGSEKNDSIPKRSNSSTDFDFSSSLANLCLSGIQESEGGSQKVLNGKIEDKKTHCDLSSDSGYSSEKNENDIDLTSARIVTLPTVNQTLPSTELVNRKPSLFCKVLCSKVKRNKASTIPKLPLQLPDVLKSLDHWKYFSFNTLSPDDIVKQKQKKLLWKLH